MLRVPFLIKTIKLSVITESLKISYIFVSWNIKKQKINLLVLGEV